jgi:hypothetical protein
MLVLHKKTYVLAAYSALAMLLAQPVWAQEFQDNDSNYNTNSAISEGTTYDGVEAVEEPVAGSATRGVEAEGYKLDSATTASSSEDSAEMRAMRYANDYSMKFLDDYAIDEAMRDRTVYERSRPEYEPQNVRLGAFILAPQIGVGYTFNDNIFSTADDEKADFITRVRPVLALKSDWNSNSLSAGVAYDAGIHQDFSDENFVDATYTLNGHLDIVQDSYISGGFLMQGKHEDRSSPDEVNGSEPTKYLISDANLEFYRKVSRILLKVNASARQFDYSTTEAPGGEIDNGNRDRYEYEAKTRVAYEFKPGYQAFVDVSYNIREYVRDSAADLRNSDGYKVSAGTSVEITDQTKAELYAGYFLQDYENENFEDASGVNYGASVLWNITRLTSIQFDANRTVSETTLSDASGFITSLADVSIEHELRRNILLSTGFSYALNEYEGIDRTDNIYTLSAGARYIITPNYTLNFDYNIQVRESDAVGRDFERNRVMLSLKAEL